MRGFIGILIDNHKRSLLLDKENISRRNHYIPQMLLRNFVDNNGLLHCYNKKSDMKKIFSSHPKNVFLETDLYLTKDQNNVISEGLEKYFSKLEGYTAEIIKKIVASVRKLEKPNLTVQEKEIWNMFFYYQWKRVPDKFRQFIPSSEDFEKETIEILKVFEKKHGSLEEDKRPNIKDPNWQERILQGAIVQALASPGSTAQTILNQKGLGFLFISKANKSFVVGSNPVLRLTYKGQSNLNDSSIEIWLPISHDIVVGPSAFQPDDERIIEFNDHEKIRYFNECVLDQSTSIAGRSIELITSLTKFC